MNESGDKKVQSPKGSTLFIEPGCISCGSCAFTAPEIFEVTDRSRIKEDADIDAHTALIEKAAARCPVSVITFKK